MTRTGVQSALERLVQRLDDDTLAEIEEYDDESQAVRMLLEHIAPVGGSPIGMDIIGELATDFVAAVCKEAYERMDADVMATRHELVTYTDDEVLG